MTDNDLDDIAQQFLVTLFEQTNGDVSMQVSMYDVGEMLSLDRDTASAVAQELMGRQLAEIRTLSGGIGISAEGSAKVQELIGPMGPDSSVAEKLGRERILAPGGRQTVEQVFAELKKLAGSLGLDFETLGELMADLKTMEAQLESTRPKTAIIRECLRSVLDVVEKGNRSGMAGRIRRLVAE